MLYILHVGSFCTSTCELISCQHVIYFSLTCGLHPTTFMSIWDLVWFDIQVAFNDLYANMWINLSLYTDCTQQHVCWWCRHRYGWCRHTIFWPRHTLYTRPAARARTWGLWGASICRSRSNRKDEHLPLTGYFIVFIHRTCDEPPAPERDNAS